MPSRIAVDAMGGDRAPGPEVAGAVAAVCESAVEVVLVGDRPLLTAEIHRLSADVGSRIAIVHAAERVTMRDNPGQVFRQKPASSLRLAFDLVKEGRAEAVVSGGNSGAVLSHALFVLGRLPGLERPGIVTVFPTPHGRLVLCDAGANVVVKPAMLAQFGVLGASYDRIVHGHGLPRVGLLCNGTEPEKGTDLTRAADALLRRAAKSPGPRFRYTGYVEGSHLFDGDIDVVATDGFTGNIALKLAEGVATAVFGMIRVQLEKNALGRIGGILAKPTLAQLAKSIDYAETGGALLAGVGSVVAMCHGRSDGNAFKNAIQRAAHYVRVDMPARLGEAIARHEPIWRSGQV